MKPSLDCAQVAFAHTLGKKFPAQALASTANTAFLAVSGSAICDALRGNPEATPDREEEVFNVNNVPLKNRLVGR